VLWVLCHARDGPEARKDLVAVLPLGFSALLPERPSVRSAAIRRGAAWVTRGLSCRREEPMPAMDLRGLAVAQQGPQGPCGAQYCRRGFALSPPVPLLRNGV
jgi:hypothetical protein